MTNKPKFKTFVTGETFDNLSPSDFKKVLQIHYRRGGGFAIDWDESLVPFLEQDMIEALSFLIIDSAYRLRPDLRKQ